MCLENLHVFESLPAHLALDLLPLPGQDDVMRLAEMSPVRLLSRYHQVAMRTAYTKLFSAGWFYRDSGRESLDCYFPRRLLSVVSFKLGFNLDRGRLRRDHLTLHHLGWVNVSVHVVVIQCSEFPLPVSGLHLDVGQRSKTAEEVDERFRVVFAVEGPDCDVELLVGDLGEDETVCVAEVHHPEAGRLEDGNYHGLV